MRTRIMVVAVAALMGEASVAQAQGWCGFTAPGDNHNGKPECDTGPGIGTITSAVHQRINNICGVGTTAEKINVDIVYPDPIAIAPGQLLTPVIFQHGGGVAPSFCDKHTNDTTFPFDCGPSYHFSNPYGYVAEQIANKGAVVMFPIVNIGPGSTPSEDSMDVLNAITCLGNRTTQVIGPGGCGEAGEPTCLPDLTGHVAWSPTNKGNLVYVGHSAGGVVGLYMPQRLGSALKAIIMVDPAKAEYVANPPTGLDSGTPIIHIYPDWYGPLQNWANNLFSLGTSPDVTGPWVPIGIRDDDGLCDPDAGCHSAQHCTSMNDRYSWVAGYDQAGHGAYCNFNTTSCTGMQGSSACEGTATECGRNTVCTNNASLNGGADWHWGKSYNYAYRYIVTYAACMGGTHGAYFQSWVNGKDRDFDDTGSNAHLCVDSTGQEDAACAAYTDGTCIGGLDAGSPCIAHSDCDAANCSGGREVCRQAGCHFAHGEDGKAIRINNGQTVTEYDYHSSRNYTANEGYNTSGTCVGGVNNGQACTTDAFCGTGSNCTAGDFVERTELLSSNPADPRGISCQSGYGAF